MGGADVQGREAEPPVGGRMGERARAIVYMLGWAALIGGVIGLPWDVPNRSYELLRNVATGPDEQSARYVLDCIDQAFLSIAPGSTVVLTADDLYWYQRAIEVGFPRLRFVATDADLDITMTATAPDDAALGSTGTVWPCGSQHIMVVQRG